MVCRKWCFISNKNINEDRYMDEYERENQSNGAKTVSRFTVSQIKIWISTEIQDLNEG